MFSIQQQLYDSNDNNDVEEKKQQQNILKKTEIRTERRLSNKHRNR